MPTHYIQANTNGRLHPATEPSVSPLNRGFLYGDAIYEVWRTYHGVVFAWEEHWRRLGASAHALHMPLEFTQEGILSEIRRTVAEYRNRVPGSSDLYIRLQITRGSGAIGLDTTLSDGRDFILLVQPCPVLTPAAERDGLHLSTAVSLRRNHVLSLDPAWKTGNYLNNLLCLREARSRGADEVVMLNLNGEVTEAAVSNIAFVRRGELVTPPLESGLLGGITRGLILGGVAEAAGIAASEDIIEPADFEVMEECCLMSTTKDVVPVASIDSVRFEVGADTVTARLKKAFADYARDYSSAHPNLGV